MRLPIRLRLTLAFGAAMALLLTFAGVFLYLRLDSALLHTVDSALRVQADAVAAGIGQANTNFGDQTGASAAGVQTFAQVVDSSGRIIESSAWVARVSLVNAADLASAKWPTFLERGVPGVQGPARLLILPVNESRQHVFVLVGSSLQGRRGVLSGFLLLLAIGGPVALIVASLAGWTLAGAALRPVDRMRREAAAISMSDLARRLPVPDSGDEIARLGKTLNLMLDRLHLAFNRERRFVDDASHELRAPLAILKAELDLALMRARTPSETDRALRSASEEADRLAALADDLLVYSRTEGGRVPVHRTATRLDQLLADACMSYARRAKEAGISLEVDAPEETARLDAARVRQAVDNLLSNAVRHTPPGGRVCIHATREESLIRLIVDDTGSGIPPNFIGDAFEPFARAASERAGRSEGAGLGLAIVRAVAQAHGGHATAQNRPEGGARITLTLEAEE
jgi:two-component system OmpR family sensor kinase